MLTASQIILEYVCPSLGLITGNIMFFAPYADARQAALSNYNLGDLNPTPWAFMLGNCLGWVVYSFLLSNYFVFFANCPGFVLSVWLNMVAVKLQFCDHRSREVRTSIVGALQTEEFNKSRQFLLHAASSSSQASLKKKNDDHHESENDDEAIECRSENGQSRPTGTEKGNQHDPKDAISNNGPDTATAALEYAQLVWNVTSQATPAPAPHERLVMGMVLYWTCIVTTVALFGAKAFSAQTRQLIVGIAVNLNLVFFYAAPLSTIFRVLSTRSCSSIHVPTMLTNTFNGAFWCAYGIAVQDLFIAVPNGLGSVLGVVQIILCVLFPRRPTGNDNDARAGDNNHEGSTDEEQAGGGAAAAAAAAAATDIATSDSSPIAAAEATIATTTTNTR